MCGFWHELPVLALLLRFYLPDSSCQATDDRTIFLPVSLAIFSTPQNPQGLQKRNPPQLHPRLDELVAGQSPLLVYI